MRAFAALFAAVATAALSLQASRLHAARQAAAAPTTGGTAILGPASPGPKSVAGPQGQPAPPLGLVLSQDPWRRLLARLRREGAFTPQEAGRPARYALGRPQGAETPSRSAALWGFVRPAGGFEPVLATLESEGRRPAADGSARGAAWEAVRWEFRLRLDGSLIEASHYSRFESETGRLLDLRRVPLRPEDPRIPETLRALIDFWGS